MMVMKIKNWARYCGAPTLLGVFVAVAAQIPRPATAEPLQVIANTRPPDAFVALRTDPSSEYGRRIAVLPNGTVVDVLKRRDDGWLFLQVVSSGQQGWALSGHGPTKWIVCCAPASVSRIDGPRNTPNAISEKQHSNQCDAQNYEAEFRRKDLSPFGRKYVDWTSADYDQLRRNIVACLDPYLTSGGRREVYMAGVDRRLASFKEGQRRLAESLRAQRSAEDHAREESHNAKQIEERQRLAADRRTAITNDRLTLLQNYLAEVEAVAPTADGITRLGVILRQVQEVGEPNSMNTMLAETSFSSEQTKAVLTNRSQVVEKVIAKRESLMVSILDRRQGEFRRWASELAAGRHRITIDQLGFLVSYLDATIYTGRSGSTQKFVTLRQLAAVLAEQGKGTVSGRRFKNDDYGLAFKQPGSQSVVFGVKLDGGDLFLVRYMTGEAHEFLTNDPMEKGLVEAQLQSLIGWPQAWNAPSSIP